jgi:hypothetical protein
MILGKKWVLPTGIGLIIVILLISGTIADGIHYKVEKNEQQLFNNWNIGGVSSNPPVFPQFTVTSPIKITYVDTYHWNGGKGKKPGTIALKHSDGTIYGPWDAYPPSHHKPDQYIYWVVEPSVTIKAGTYTIIDSDPSTWSYNGQSKNAGFAAVKGLKESGSSTSPGLTLTPPITKPTDINVMGKWNVIGNGHHGVMDVNQQGNQISGKIYSGNDFSGSVSGNSISFRRDYGWGYQDFKGTISTDSSGKAKRMTGTFTQVRETAVYKWEATKA